MQKKKKKKLHQKQSFFQWFIYFLRHQFPASGLIVNVFIRVLLHINNKNKQKMINRLNIGLRSNLSLNISLR